MECGGKAAAFKCGSEAAAVFFFTSLSISSTSPRRIGKECGSLRCRFESGGSAAALHNRKEKQQ